MVDESTIDTGKGRSADLDRRPYATADPDGRAIIDEYGATFGFACDAESAARFVAALNAVEPEAALRKALEPDGRYRVGRSLGLTVYRKVGLRASKSDVVLGMIDTRRDAAMLVGSLNLHDTSSERPWRVQVRRTIEGTVTVEADTAATAVRAAEAVRPQEFMEAVDIVSDEVHTGVAQPVE